MSTAPSMNYRQLEDSINKWTQELEEQEAVFLDQATQVNAWDRLLIENGDMVTINYTFLTNHLHSMRSQGSHLILVTAQLFCSERCYISADISKCTCVKLRLGTSQHGCLHGCLTDLINYVFLEFKKFAIEDCSLDGSPNTGDGLKMK